MNRFRTKLNQIYKKKLVLDKTSFGLGWFMNHEHPYMLLQ
jgi:hypothetical protein